MRARAEIHKARDSVPTLPVPDTAPRQTTASYASLQVLSVITQQQEDQNKEKHESELIIETSH